jgi:hypothetical protein
MFSDAEILHPWTEGSKKVCPTLECDIFFHPVNTGNDHHHCKL